MDRLIDTCNKIINCEISVDKLLNQFSNVQELYKITADLEIPISPEHIINIINMHINQKISKDELVKLSLFIIMSGCYQTPEKGDDYYYDDLWTIISEMSCPEIDEPLTNSKALEYIRRLKKLI